MPATEPDQIGDLNVGRNAWNDPAIEFELAGVVPAINVHGLRRHLAGHVADEFAERVLRRGDWPEPFVLDGADAHAARALGRSG